MWHFDIWFIQFYLLEDVISGLFLFESWNPFKPVFIEKPSQISTSLRMEIRWIDLKELEVNKNQVKAIGQNGVKFRFFFADLGRKMPITVELSLGRETLLGSSTVSGRHHFFLFMLFKTFFSYLLWNVYIFVKSL